MGMTSVPCMVTKICVDRFFKETNGYQFCVDASGGTGRIGQVVQFWDIPIDIATTHGEG